MVKEKISVRKIKAAETKGKIYKCADELFREYGFDKVSVDAIVEKAEISKGAFYVHFDSKDSLIVSLIMEYVCKLDLDYRSFYEAFPDDTAASKILLSLVEEIAEILVSKIGYNLLKNVYRIQIDRPVDTNILWESNRDIYKTISDLITHGIQQGEFKSELTADTIASHFVMAMRGLTYEWCIRYPDFDLKEQLLKHFEILLEGIKKEGD
jgi:AcrR family transcriptional regulator